VTANRIALSFLSGTVANNDSTSITTGPEPRSYIQSELLTGALNLLTRYPNEDAQPRTRYNGKILGSHGAWMRHGRHADWAVCRLRLFEIAADWTGGVERRLGASRKDDRGGATLGRTHSALSSAASEGDKLAGASQNC
jgi:hypothetical protein